MAIWPPSVTEPASGLDPYLSRRRRALCWGQNSAKRVLRRGASRVWSHVGCCPLRSEQVCFRTYFWGEIPRLVPAVDRSGGGWMCVCEPLPLTVGGEHSRPRAPLRSSEEIVCEECFKMADGCNMGVLCVVEVRLGCDAAGNVIQIKMGNGSFTEECGRSDWMDDITYPSYSWRNCGRTSGGCD
ncbi:hypothetical protein PYCCODRAFT_403342 [Trametes coccinea BRFM310]|uniref:Uncharacterized protein n=1 Tax=Trametes coccinea (strain BRFM310) TaxID=1353009 RepID=A0A1Y2IPA9_TRAC3|nr:hypothetical protein PYCCODRAFT_403342 [Trametes coccinea BRFM310]